MSNSNPSEQQRRSTCSPYDYSTGGCDYNSGYLLSQPTPPTIENRLSTIEFKLDELARMIELLSLRM